MTIVIQDSEHQRYIAGPLKWTREIARAVTFTSCRAALDWCRLNHVIDGEILLKFEDSGYDVYINLGRVRHS